jgi:serine/threonine protein phosphatase PrpC
MAKASHRSGGVIYPGDSNRDFAAWRPPEKGRPGLLAAVADGVGGAKGGRVAAETAVRLFLDAQDELNPLRGVKANAVSAFQPGPR